MSLTSPRYLVKISAHLCCSFRGYVWGRRTKQIIPDNVSSEVWSVDEGVAAIVSEVHLSLLEREGTTVFTMVLVSVWLPAEIKRRNRN